MSSIFNRLFKRNITDADTTTLVQKPAPVAPAPMPATARIPNYNGISFYADLIPKLQNDHRVVLSIYGELMKRANDGDWVGVNNSLQMFRAGLQDHLLDEAIRLYVYLNRNIEDTESKYLARQFRVEMDKIGRVVLASLDRYKNIDLSPALQETFIEEWRGIGGVLGDRIRREEQTLYPLYAREVPQTAEVRAGGMENP